MLFSKFKFETHVRNASQYQIPSKYLLPVWPDGQHGIFHTVRS